MTQQALLPEVIERPSLQDRLMELALDPNTDADKLTKLLDAQLRWEANVARKAYIASIQQFKANLPEISKSKHIQYATSSGGQVDYWYAPLDAVCKILIPALKAVGITHSWRTSDQGGKTTVTCVLTHSMGHSEEAATLSGPADTSGGKNSIQAIGSTVYYLQRYTFLAAIGVAAEGHDDDGRSGECMPDQAIEEYCIAMGDETEMPGLQKVFKEAYQKAKALKDSSAQARLTKVYETEKRKILGSSK
jgi:hypothetical protein